MNPDTDVPFTEAVRLDAQGDGRFNAVVPPGWGQGRAAYGGLLGALAVRAAGTAVPAERPLRTLALNFVGPAHPGPVRLVPRVLREGRSLTHVAVEVRQGDAVCASALLGFGAHRPEGVGAPAEGAPEVPAPDGLAELPFVAGVTPEFTRRFAYRWTVPSLPFSGADEARVQGWIRHREPAPADAASVVGLLDAWPPPVWSVVDRPVAGSSVSWLVTLHAPEVLSGEASGWWLYDARCVFAGGGYSDLEARLWGRDGRLVATSRQLFADFP